MGATPQLEKPADRSQRPWALRRSRLRHEPLAPLDRSSDERLARRASTGDKQALGAIFERYQQELYRFCLGLLGEPQDAQDALQNTMVKALKALPGEKREIAIRPWLYRIAHNEAINLHRARHETQTLDRHLLDGHSSIVETAEHRERLQWLLRDLGDLPERQRAVLIMRELSGLDFADIGAALGTSGAVVRQTLYEARRNLEQMDFGRGLRCEVVARVLSDADGRISGRREIRAHLRDCSDCRRFQERIQTRKEALAGIAPLPAGAAAGILQSVLGGAGGSGAGGLAAALGGGAAKQIGAVGGLKAIAAIAAMAVVGTAAVERNLHDRHVANEAAAAPLSRQGHARAPSAARPLRLRAHRARSTAHNAPAIPVPVIANAPSSAVRDQRSSAAEGHKRSLRDQVAAADRGSSAHAPTAAGKSPPSLEATPESSASPPKTEKPSKLAKQVEKQEKKATKEEEKTAKKEEQAAKAEAKGKPEHPTHPEHPAHPAQSQKPAKVPTTPEEGAQEAEAAPAPEAEAPSEPASPGSKGKAKGHEKQLSD